MSAVLPEASVAPSRPSQVDLWLLNPEQVRALAPLALDLLPPGERREDLRRKDENAWKPWAGRQAALRLLLGSYLGSEAGALRLCRDQRGKPELAGGAGPKFSVSSSEGWWLAALSDQEVGVDLERIRPGVDVEGVARRYFNEQELAYLQALVGEEERLHYFYRCWTRKEALLKLRGLGLAGLAALSDAENAGDSWVENLNLQEGLEMSLAMRRPPSWMRRRTWVAPESSGPRSGPRLPHESGQDTGATPTEASMPKQDQDQAQERIYSISEVGPQEDERLNKQALLWLHMELPTILETLPKAGRLVDLGCGTGLLADAVAQSCPDAHIWGFDFDPLAVEHARKQYGHRKGLHFDCRRLEQGPPPGFPLADVVILRLVIMHLAKPERAIEAAGAWLRPGGVLHIVEGDDRDVVLEPAPACLPELLNLMQEVQKQRGGSRHLGRDLAGLLDPSAWSIAGTRTFSLDPMATAAALPKVFMPVVEFYLSEAERLQLARPELMSVIRRDLEAVRAGSVLRATIPMFHLWAQSLAGTLA